MLRVGNKFTLEQKKVNAIFMNGGLGDHVASLVAVDYAAKTYPWVKFLVWVPDYLLELSRHLLPNEVKVNNFSSMRTKYNRNFPTRTTEWDGVVSPMKIHLLDYAFLKLCDENPGVDKKNYLRINPDKINIKKFNLPENYVVITAGFTAKVREFLVVHVNEIVKFVKSKNVNVVFLGQTFVRTGSMHTIKGNFSQEIDFKGSVNLIDNTSLLEAAKIMHESKAVIGVDNGLMHVAGCTDAPIVGGFTTVSPAVRWPVRHSVLGWNCYPVVPDDDLDCKFCQEKTNFLFGHDYRNCLYKDNLCTEQMMSNKFVQHLEKIL
jgi:ADP-heptose:LPS heptosyltransferase